MKPRDAARLERLPRHREDHAEGRQDRQVDGDAGEERLLLQPARDQEQREKELRGEHGEKARHDEDGSHDERFRVSGEADEPHL